MGTFKKGDRVQVSGGATGRVIAVMQGALYRVAYDTPDAFGNRQGDYLADAMRLRRRTR